MSTGLILIGLLGAGLIILGLGQGRPTAHTPIDTLTDKVAVDTRLDAMRLQLQQALLAQSNYKLSLSIQSQPPFEELYGGSWSDFKREYGKSAVDAYVQSLGVGVDQSTADVPGSRESAYYYFAKGTDIRLTQQPPVVSPNDIVHAISNLEVLSASVQENAGKPDEEKLIAGR